MTDLSNILTNKKLSENIKDLIAHNRLPHAMLIYGGNNTIRMTAAKFIAMALVCENSKKPCMNCVHCIKAENSSHPDIILKDPEIENEKTFKVALVRDLRQDAFIIPNEADKKVYILNSADKMNPQAQNALLKIIEEPPEYARFILLCDTVAPMLDTIISRVTAFNIGENVVEEESEINHKSFLTAKKVAQALSKPTELELLKITAEFEKDKDLMAGVLSPLQKIIRDSVALKSGSDISISGCREESEVLASKLTLKALINLIEVIDSLNENIKHNANKNLLITRFSSVLRTAAYGK